MNRESQQESVIVKIKSAIESFAPETGELIFVPKQTSKVVTKKQANELPCLNSLQNNSKFLNLMPKL